MYALLIRFGKLANFKCRKSLAVPWVPESELSP